MLDGLTVGNLSRRWTISWWCWLSFTETIWSRFSQWELRPEHHEAAASNGCSFFRLRLNVDSWRASLRIARRCLGPCLSDEGIGPVHHSLWSVLDVMQARTFERPSIHVEGIGRLSNRQDCVSGPGPRPRRLSDFDSHFFWHHQVEYLRTHPLLLLRFLRWAGQNRRVLEWTILLFNFTDWCSCSYISRFWTNTTVSALTDWLSCSLCKALFRLGVRCFIAMR